MVSGCAAGNENSNINSNSNACHTLPLPLNTPHARTVIAIIISASRTVHIPRMELVIHFQARLGECHGCAGPLRLTLQVQAEHSQTSGHGAEAED